MKHIKRIHHENGETQLQIICPHCQKYILIGEDDNYCFQCHEEIEMANIQAWTEYYIHTTKQIIGDINDDIEALQDGEVAN